MFGIIASEASRKNFDVPNNIIERLHKKNFGGELGGGGHGPPWPPPLDPPLGVVQCASWLRPPHAKSVSVIGYSTA